MDIIINHSPSEETLLKLGVRSWPLWTKEISEFPWTYDEKEACYFLEGAVVVTPANESPVHIGKGDFVIFPKGMNCVWKISAPVKKHYQFG